MSLLGLLLSLLVIMNRGAAGQHASRVPSFPSYEHENAVRSLSASHNKFAVDLYLHLAKKKSGNLFHSPFSIMTALGMAYAGAGGNTETQMRSVMHFDADKEVTHDGFGDIITDLKTDSEDYELRTSNMAYVSHSLSLMSQFGEVLKKVYQSTVKSVDFGDGENVRQEINSAVEKETNSRITDLIPSGILNSLTRMVLVNAVYFKGFWDRQFDEKATYDQEFWTSNEISIKVPMMHNKAHYHYYYHKDLGATMLGMDYQGNRLSMVFVLPDKRDGLAELEAKLAEANLNDLAKKLRRVEVEVAIPKMKLEESLDLEDNLSEMGMKDLFDEKSADLSGISGSKDLFVSKVIHKAFLEVNEKGSEAAAATGIIMTLSAFVSELPTTFIADHPFIFYIRDRNTGLILFIGRLVNV